MCVAAKSLQSCPTLCDPIDGSPPGSPVPGILQARTLEWVAISFSNAWEWKMKVKSLSHVRLLATPMDCSLPGSSIHGIFQARVLERDAIAFSEYVCVNPQILIYSHFCPGFFIFILFIYRNSCYLFFFLILATPRGMWTLVPWTKDRTLCPLHWKL